MKLDYDCVRDILLALEETLVYFQENDIIQSNVVFLDQLCQHPSMLTYSKESIVYASAKLIEAEYITARVLSSDSGLYDIWYQDISYRGHQYIDSIRSNTVWQKIKEEFSKKTCSYDTIPYSRNGEFNNLSNARHSHKLMRTQQIKTGIYQFLCLVRFLFSQPVKPIGF